jgi:hypothetical protein
MKALLITIAICFSAQILPAQQSQYITNTSNMKIMAVKNGEHYEWENTNITVRFDYKTGEFIAYLKNTDFVSPDLASSLQKDTLMNKRTLTLEGTLPINDIINQQKNEQEYNVELQLKNNDLNLSEPILFDMHITRPESGASKSYRMFTLHGILYNDELHLPAFDGFDNKIEVWLIFSGFMNIQ